MKKALFILTLGIALACCGIQPVLAAASKARAIARLSGPDGRPLGSAKFIATSHGVLIEFDLKGLPPGGHAMHIHTSGSCDTKLAFTSAGPDFSPEPNKMHGYLSGHGPHAGDLPNQFAAGDGTLHASVISNAFSLGNGKKSIFDRDGASLIVHARADDYANQPAGNSGDRIACGVIMRTVAPGTRKSGAHRAHT